MNNNNTNRFNTPNGTRAHEMIDTFEEAQSPQELAAFFDGMRDALGMRASPRLKDGVAGVMALGRYRDGDGGHILIASEHHRMEVDVPKLKVLFDNMSKATMGACLVATMKHVEDKKALVLAKELVGLRGVSPSAANFSGEKRTALHYAKGTAVVKYLIAAGANVNARDAAGQTPLFLIDHASPAKIKALLAAGANPNARDANGMTPLFMYPDSPDIIRALIRAGANPNLKNNRGDTALRFLLKRLEFIGKRSASMVRTPLKVAETVRILMAATNAKPSNIGNIKIANLPANIRNAVGARANLGVRRFMTAKKALNKRLPPNMSNIIMRRAF
jgi:hypothetical protein